MSVTTNHTKTNMKRLSAILSANLLSAGLFIRIAIAHPDCGGDAHCIGAAHEGAAAESPAFVNYSFLSDQYNTYTITPVTTEVFLGDVVLSNCNTGTALMPFLASVFKNDSISSSTAAELPASAGIVGYIYMDLQMATGAAGEPTPLEVYSGAGGLIKRQSVTDSPITNHDFDWAVPSCTIITLSPFYTKTTASTSTGYRECIWKCQHYWFDPISGVLSPKPGGSYPSSTCGISGTISGSSTAHGGVSINQSDADCPKTGACVGGS